MDNRIKEHLKHLNRYYLNLKDFQNLSQEDLNQKEYYKAAAERYLQLAIESCLNIGNRIISLYQFKYAVRTPENYADIFRELFQIGAIDKAFSDRLVKMTKFRNRLVHMYWEIDTKDIYRIIHDCINDFQYFRDKTVDFIKNNPLDK